MKNRNEALSAKEQAVRETEALRFVLGLLDKEDGPDPSPANTPGGRPAIRVLTNSGRLEVVVGDTPRLRFDGRLSMAVEVREIGNEFHIFLPTPQPGDTSLEPEEGAA